MERRAARVHDATRLQPDERSARERQRAVPEYLGAEGGFATAGGTRDIAQELSADPEWSTRPLQAARQGVAVMWVLTN